MRMKRRRRKSDVRMIYDDFLKDKAGQLHGDLKVYNYLETGE